MTETQTGLGCALGRRWPVHNPTTDLTVANTIAQQIGHLAFVMMGTKHKLGGADFLSFDIRGCPDFGKIQVTLEQSDTYKVEFFKFRQFKRVNYKVVDMIYADGLHQCIEANTG